jgi:F-box and leucine-rich repeat protein 1 (S-phase kinase-associated protein 2)
MPLLGLLTSLGAHCALLEELEVRRYSTTQDEPQQAVQGWEALTKGCPRLSILTARHCILTDDAVAAIAQGFPQLHTLWLEDNYSQSQLTDRAMHAVAQNCQNLYSLQLHRYTKVTDSGLCAIAAGCPNLRSIKLQTVSCGDAPCLHWLSTAATCAFCM